MVYLPTYYLQLATYQSQPYCEKASLRQALSIIGISRHLLHPRVRFKQAREMLLPGELLVVGRYLIHHQTHTYCK